jgi:outer membrane protein OmpA-like peptidoglycan-associated protein
MGDMDLYRTRRDTINGAWREPVNLGYPINSPENDIYFVLNKDESTAYISSVRQENIGEQDIYKVDMTSWNPPDIKRLDYAELFAENASIEKALTEQASAPPSASVSEIPKPAATGEATISITVYDALTNDKLNSQVFLRGSDGSSYEMSNPERGVYSAKLKTENSGTIYKLEINSIGYAPQQATIYLGGITDSDINFNDTIRLQKLAVNVPTLIDIYFGHDSDEPLSFNGIQDFINMMNQSPNMMVEIGGHTDSLGPEEYNQMLSQRRAGAVKKYLERLGVDGKRVNAVGYGESRPVAPNDSQEGRRLNRRTEFTIIKQ